MLPILQLGVLLLDADWVKLVMWSRSIIPFLVAFSTWSHEKRHVKRHQDDMLGRDTQVKIRTLC